MGSADAGVMDKRKEGLGRKGDRPKDFGQQLMHEWKQDIAGYFYDTKQ